MLNLAHRGFSGAFPENTGLAFEKALEAGADGIELDVHLSKDGVVVINHDEYLDRTSDLTGLLMDYNFVDLKRGNFAKNYPGLREEILSLEEYFDLIKGHEVLTNIELKNSIIDYPQLEEKTLDLVKKYGLEERVIISSFNHKSLLRVKGIDKNILCGALESSRLFRPWAYVKDLGLDFYHPINFSVDRELVEECRRLGLGVNVRFGDSNYDLERIAGLGVNAIISDYPDRVGKIIENL